MSDQAETKPTEETPVVEPTEAPAATEAAASTTEEASEAKTEETGDAKTEESPKVEEEAAKPDEEAAKPTDEAAAEPAAEESKEEKTEGATVAEPEVVEEEPEPIEIPSGNGELVLVTGATGYLASHIVKQLAESGEFKVRGTVRSLEDNARLDKLKSLVQDSKYEVEFVAADLTKPESWTDAVAGCDYVIHTASPFPVTEPSDASEVIDPARDGTLAVMKACVEAKTVKRVVLTSSIVAMTGGRTLDKNACNEEMWADADKCSSAYDKSKAIAEKAAWDFIKELPEGNTLELSVVNPGFIVGPPLMNLDSTSVEVIKKLMNREYSVLPKISFSCSDVRDVALAHIRAMMIKQAAGHRHIVAGASVWLKDMANMMSQEFNSQGFNIPTSQAPYVLVWIKSHFDPAIKRILPEVGKMYNFETKRMKQVLQVEPRDVKDSLVEMGHAMINLQIVQKVEKPEKKPRKLTFRKKKEVKKDMEEEEEKKDEPEKAASTSGSADGGSVPDTAIEDVEIKVTEEASVSAEDRPEEATTTTEEAKAEDATEGEVKVEAEGEAAAQSEEDAKEESPASDPETSTKKDKKAKKEKKEKKKGGLFSFSFKKSKKPHVEKKATEGDKSDDGEAAAAPAAEEVPATEEAQATPETAAPEESKPTEEVAAPAEESVPEPAEEKPAADEETKGDAPAETVEEAAKVEETRAKEDETPAKEEETPAKEEETPAKEEETPAKEEIASSAKTEDTSAPAESTSETPAA